MSPKQLNYQDKVMFQTILPSGVKCYLRYNPDADVYGFTLVPENQIDIYCHFQINENNPSNTHGWPYSGNQDADTNGCHGNFRINCLGIPSDNQITSVNFDGNSNLSGVPIDGLYAGVSQHAADDYETFVCFQSGNFGYTGNILDGDMLVIRNLKKGSRPYLGFNDTGDGILANRSDINSAAQFKVVLAEYSKWMTMFGLSNLTLAEIMIPGTHDSGSYSLVNDVPDFALKIIKIIDEIEKYLPGDALYNYVKGWSVTQHTDILHQLLSGARYIDLRVGYDPKNNVFRTHHGYFGTTINDIFAQVNAYMNVVQGSNEVVIIRAGHMDNFDLSLHSQFVAFIQQNLGQYLYSRETVSSNIGDNTIGTITASGPKVILIYDDPIFETNFKNTEMELWGVNQINDPFVGETSVSDLSAQRQTVVENGSNPPTLTEIQWIITPPDSGSAMINGAINPLAPHNLIAYSSGCNSAFSLFYGLSKSYPFNFVFLSDFLEHSQVVLYAVLYNWKLNQTE